jgi:hypothetical protein
MIRRGAILVLGLFLIGAARAADDDTSLSAASGVIDKVSKTTLSVQPRSAGGRFEKTIKLHVTGTSQVTKLGHQVRSGKSVFVQKEAAVKELKAKQPIAVIYGTDKGGPVLLTAVEGAEGTTVTAITGVIDKASAGSVTVQPRGPGGKFEKAVALTVTGTTRVTRLGHEKRAGKLVFTQKDADVKDLKGKQTIAAIYATGKGGPVLLTAVVVPASGK